MLKNQCDFVLLDVMNMLLINVGVLFNEVEKYFNNYVNFEVIVGKDLVLDVQVEVSFKQMYDVLQQFIYYFKVDNYVVYGNFDV